MAGILNIASSGLNAFQRSLQVTANNLTNVGNHNYTRQTIQFAQAASHRVTGSFIGGGVTVAAIKRNSDRFATEQVRESTTTKSQYDTFYQQAIQLDKLFSQEGTSISTSLQTFFNSVNELNKAPDSLSARNLMLQQSHQLGDQFNSLQLRLDEYQRNNTTQIQQTVEQINQITTGLAKVNELLAGSPGSPELLDQRDSLLVDLATFTSVTVIDQADGSIAVAVGNGEMLVMGSASFDMAINPNQNGRYGTQIVMPSGASLIDITNTLHSGALGGLIDFEEKVIGFGSQMIGQMAIGLAQNFNSQHQLGMDMNSLIGKEYFTDYNKTNLQLARSSSWSMNTGTAVLSVAISDIGQTQLSDYELVVTDAASNEVRLFRKSDGQSSLLTWSSSPPAPPAGQFVIDGMTITVDDTASLVNADRFSLSPTRGAAGYMDVQIRDPREIAFASPVRTEASLANIGTGSIQLGTVFNAGPDVMKQYSIQFITPTEYNLINLTDSVTTGPITFVPNADNTLMIPDALNPAFSVVLSGIPEAGDNFSTSYNSGGIGDNRNGLLLAAFQQSKIFDGGTGSVFDKYSSLITGVGGVTYQAKVRGDAADILFKSAVNAREGISGVNMEEEGANMLFFQQAFQAASKLMAVSNEIMDVLFASMR